MHDRSGLFFFFFFDQGSLCICLINELAKRKRACASFFLRPKKSDDYHPFAGPENTIADQLISMQMEKPITTRLQASSNFICSACKDGSKLVFLYKTDTQNIFLSPLLLFCLFQGSPLQAVTPVQIVQSNELQKSLLLFRKKFSIKLTRARSLVLRMSFKRSWRRRLTRSRFYDKKVGNFFCPNTIPARRRFLQSRWISAFCTYVCFPDLENLAVLTRYHVIILIECTISVPPATSLYSTLPMQPTREVVVDCRNAFWQTCPTSVKLFARKRFQHQQQLQQSAASKKREGGSGTLFVHSKKMSFNLPLGPPK